jgi:hypothetical protein
MDKEYLIIGNNYWFVNNVFVVGKGCLVGLEDEKEDNSIICTISPGTNTMVITVEVPQHEIFYTEREALEYAINTSRILEIQFNDKVKALKRGRERNHIRMAKNTRGKYLRDTLRMFEYFYDNPGVKGIANWPGWDIYKEARSGPCPVCRFNGGPVRTAADLCYSKCLVPIFAKEGGCHDKTGIFKRWCYTENYVVRKELGYKIILSIRKELKSNYTE